MSKKTYPARDTFGVKLKPDDIILYSPASRDGIIKFYEVLELCESSEYEWNQTPVIAREIVKAGNGTKRKLKYPKQSMVGDEAFMEKLRNAGYKV